MRGVLIRQLLTEVEMKDYSEGYWDAFNGRVTRSIHPLDPKVLMTYDRVMGVFQDGKLMGGFIVNKYPHRCFESFSPEQLKAVTENIGGVESCGELVAIWKTRGLRGFSTKVWPRIIIESLGLGKPNVFGSVYTTNKIKDTYTVLNPHHVATVGDTRPLEIFYYGRYRLVGTFFANAVIRSGLGAMKMMKLYPAKKMSYKDA